MKKSFITILLAAAALSAVTVACNKETPAQQDLAPASDGEIILNVGDTFDAVLDTKTTAVTSVPGTLYWGASTGSGTETAKWSSASATVSAGKISTGKYQTATPTTYNFYVANQTFSVGSSTTMTVANNNTDVVCGRASSYSTTPSVTLNHIFCRTGSFTMNTQTGYNISSVSWKIVGKSDINGTAGTYNLTSDSWTSASTKLSSDTAITSSSDMYLIPATYTIKCTYTLSKGDWSGTFTKSADVTLVKGKINNITGTATGGGASEIVLSVSLTDWGTQDHTPTFS